MTPASCVRTLIWPPPLNMGRIHDLFLEYSKGEWAITLLITLHYISLCLASRLDLFFPCFEGASYHVVQGLMERAMWQERVGSLKDLRVASADDQQKALVLKHEEKNSAKNLHELGSGSIASQASREEPRPGWHLHCSLTEDMAKLCPDFWPTETVRW